MADLKISQLNSIVTVVPATDVLPVVQGGTTLKITPNQILGAGGTATLASATITGDLTVDTSTLKVDSTNDRVGIGTVTPAVKLTVRTSHAVATATTYTGGFLIHDEVNGIAPHLNAGIAYDGGNQHSWIQSNDTTGVFPLALNPAGGDVRIGANLVMLTSGKGIDFSATAGTGTSELLNDYEEGTFTPTVIGTTTAGTGTYTSQVGRYTKIGNLVTIQVYLAWTAHTGTGNMRFGNFPFNTASDAGSLSAAAIGYVNNIALTAGNILTAFTSVSNSFIAVYQTPAGGGASTEVPIDTSGDIVFTLTYRA